MCGRPDVTNLININWLKRVQSSSFGQGRGKIRCLSIAFESVPCIVVRVGLARLLLYSSVIAPEKALFTHLCCANRRF